jgi:spore coat protein U-like protein
VTLSIVALMLPALAQGQQQFACPPTPATCDIIVPAVSFGSVTPSEAVAAQLSVFTLTVTCSRTTEIRPRSVTLQRPIEILLQLEGLPARTERFMLGATGQAHYTLYLDPAQTQSWGDGSDNTQAISDTLQLAPDQRTTTRVYSLYGRVDVDPRLAAGHYTGAVTVNLRYTLNCIAIAPRALPRKP